MHHEAGRGDIGQPAGGAITCFLGQPLARLAIAVFRVGARGFVFGADAANLIGGGLGRHGAHLRARGKGRSGGTPSSPMKSLARGEARKGYDIPIV